MTHPRPYEEPVQSDLDGLLASLPEAIRADMDDLIRSTVEALRRGLMEGEACERELGDGDWYKWPFDVPAEHEHLYPHKPGPVDQGGDYQNRWRIVYRRLSYGNPTQSLMQLGGIGERKANRIYREVRKRESRGVYSALLAATRAVTRGSTPPTRS